MTSTHAVELSRQADGSVQVAGRTYTAVVDPRGRLSSLVIAGQEFFADGGSFLSNATVAVTGSKVTARNEKARAEFVFDDAGIEVTTEGDSLDYQLSKSVSAVITKDGSATRDPVGDVSKVVAGKSAFAISEPFHAVHGRFFPSRLAARGGKPEDHFTYRIECGVDVQPAELLSIRSLDCADCRLPQTPTFARGEKPNFRLDLASLGLTAATAEVRFRVLDHCVRGASVFEKTQPVTVAAGQTNAVTQEIALSRPGLYWVHADVLRGETLLKGSLLGLIYDAANYRPPLTRPPDFKEFWDKKLAEMRAIPFDAKLTESPPDSNERFVHYGLEITVARGKRIQTFLRVPRAAGPHDAEVYSHWGSDTPDKILAGLNKLEKQPEGAGMWERGGDRIRVGAPQPEDSTYTRWNGRDDNNLLDSYLRNVRMADYLRSREDVKGIWLFGASRSGASMLAAAALAPERVVAVNVHVPTCCGLSWADKPYRGWGRPPAETPAGLRIAAYFDPVNFAPDLTVPVVLDGGFYDGLAPAPGVLAFANWADQAPFKRCSIELGQHGYFQTKNRPQMEYDLAEFLATAGEGKNEKR